MHKSILQFINDCEISKLSKYERNRLKIEFNITPTPTKPFEISKYVFTIGSQKILHTI